MAADTGNEAADVREGLGLTILFHLIGQVVLLVVGGFIWIGLSQLLYIVPAIIYFKRKGRPGVVKGLMIGASVTFLLNASCFGLMFLGMSLSSKGT